MLTCMAAVTASAQDNQMTIQRVDSRKGYVARIPGSATLDSANSGWNPEERFERRVYRIDKAGQIRFTVTVKPMEIPESATQGPAYTYLDADSSTSAGTAYIRTFYLPTRSVRIELIPDGMGMQPYIDARAAIFDSFRWKPGAASGIINTP
jgi:hypothetical protein